MANKPGSPRRSRISRKTIAQGRPVAPAEPVVLPRAFLLHADHGCQPAPGLPCALSQIRGRLSGKTRTPCAARTRMSVSLRCHAPLQAGHPVFQRRLCLSDKPLEYWIARSSPTICTHLRRRPLRRVPFSESMMPRNVWGQKMEGSLGRFGDRRLEKGGSACWPVWLVSDNPASVCVAWVAIERARCGLRASCVIRV